MTFDFATNYSQTSPIEDTEVREIEYADFPVRRVRSKAVRKTRVTGQTSRFMDHLERAEKFMDAGDFNAAYSELEAAAERFMTYKDSMKTSLNKSIAHLTTLGSRATAPHPKALPLTRLRRDITA